MPREPDTEDALSDIERTIERVILIAAQACNAPTTLQSARLSAALHLMRSEVLERIRRERRRRGPPPPAAT